MTNHEKAKQVVKRVLEDYEHDKHLRDLIQDKKHVELLIAIATTQFEKE